MVTVWWEVIHCPSYSPRQRGSGYRQCPSIWHTVDVLPFSFMPSWHRKIILAPRPVPASIFSSQPLFRGPGWPQLISNPERTQTIRRNIREIQKYHFQYNASVLLQKPIKPLKQCMERKKTQQFKKKHILFIVDHAGTFRSKTCQNIQQTYGSDETHCNDINS